MAAAVSRLILNCFQQMSRHGSSKKSTVQLFSTFDDNRQFGEGDWHCSVSKCLKGWLEGGQTSALRQYHSFFDLENPNVGTAEIADCPTE